MSEEIDIDQAVDEVNSIINDAASASNLIYSKVHRKPSSKQKPWFNDECACKRKAYHRAKNYTWRRKALESKSTLIKTSKAVVIV